MFVGGAYSDGLLHSCTLWKTQSFIRIVGFEKKGRRWSVYTYDTKIELNRSHKRCFTDKSRLGWENCHHQRHSSSSSLLCEELWGPRLHSVARRVCWVDCHLSLGCHLQSLKSCFISITQFRSVLHEKGVKGCWWWCSLRLDEESRFSRGLRGE